MKDFLGSYQKMKEFLGFYKKKKKEKWKNSEAHLDTSPKNPFSSSNSLSFPLYW